MGGEGEGEKRQYRERERENVRRADIRRKDVVKLPG